MSNITSTAATESAISQSTSTDQLASNPTPLLQAVQNKLQPDIIELDSALKAETISETASIRVTSSLGKGASAMNLDVASATALYEKIEGML